VPEVKTFAPLISCVIDDALPIVNKSDVLYILESGLIWSDPFFNLNFGLIW